MKLNKDYYKTPGAKMMAFRRYQKEHCATCGCCAGSKDASSGQMCYIGWLLSEIDAEDTARAASAAREREKALDFHKRYPHLKYDGDLTHPYVHPTEALALDNRAANALRRNKIDTMDRLLELDESDLGRMPGLGIKSIHLILNALTDYNRYAKDHAR